MVRTCLLRRVVQGMLECCVMNTSISKVMVWYMERVVQDMPRFSVRNSSKGMVRYMGQVWYM